MWHKLFKSKSAKLSSSSTLSNTSTSDQPGRFCSHLDCSNTSCSHINCNENNTSTNNNNKSTSNKFTNALKRVTLKRAHSAGSNSNSKKLQKQNGIINNRTNNGDDENVSVLEQMSGFRDYHEFAMSSAINVPTRETDDRHLTSFSTFRVGSAGKFEKDVSSFITSLTKVPVLKKKFEYIIIKT